MFTDAKDLLKSHRQILCRLQAAKIELKAYTAKPSADTDDIIESMALGKRLLDGMPKSRNYGSSTEYIAMRYHGHLHKEAASYEARINGLKSEIRGLKTQLALYEAVMASLNERETQFVALYYDQDMSYAHLSETCILPNSQTYYSISTLRRMNQAILRKADEIIQPIAHQYMATY